MIAGKLTPQPLACYPRSIFCVHALDMRRIYLSILFLCAILLLVPAASGQIEFQLFRQKVIETSLEAFSRDNNRREDVLKQLFLASGCAQDHLTEQAVKKKMPPNLICTVPGKTDRVILVGAHTDHAEIGDGVVDNWSGASLLPSLLYSLSGEPRQHTFVFVGFTGEEKGMLGSEFYAAKLSKEERSKIDAVVNLDTLGLGPTKVWGSRADKQLLEDLVRISISMKLPIAAVNVERVGSTDSESFARFSIPRITIHSVTQQTWTILHTNRDALSAIHLDDYYASYRLLAGYVAYLDTALKPPAAVPPPVTH